MKTKTTINNILKLPLLPLLVASLVAILAASKTEKRAIEASQKTGGFVSARWADLTTCQKEHAERVLGPDGFKLTNKEVGLFFGGVVFFWVIWAAVSFRVTIR